ncbi:MAG: hypothetical protein GTO53_10290 [Planctomycetales bacterium]|nr:hypothetical protein [Planctomycetales bacterium]NIM09509.1 hypothetical protein [Planctomycetales bacterium]NIN08997.1 hypothetical protein [Planctomycetales bacterium]NIN78112.1 hypothetical protein [Planctomycetales bacterium]NIO35292.1 hypothetical protein [Planctomycetales bacterium]
MTQNAVRRLLIATGVVAGLTLADGHRATAADCGYPVNQLDLFHNYYAEPGICGHGIPAKMYLSPRPTPAWVGHTYVTYQPLMPHEFLYKHHRTYIRRHADGSGTRTTVRWY